MRAWEVGRAALGAGTRWRSLSADASRAAEGEALAWLPLAGAAVGAVAAGAGAVGLMASPLAGAVMAVAGLETLSPRVVRPFGVAVAGGKVAALLGSAGAPWPLLLVLAPMLGRWAMVVQCYGGAPVAGAAAASFAGRARFREFGWASVTAIGAALVVADALGLVLVLGAALLTVGVRVLAYRRAHGLTATDLARTDTLVELVVLALPAMLAALARGLSSGVAG
jgi:hypothetical protein